ncbi:MAG: hypothetical protein EP301_00585 [Gammaproteobacteria bacterium]|nr:MAG: hypothetical protein EP301_00585 [Gammaproteobacteria bacterium]
MKKQQESTVVMERQGNRRHRWARLAPSFLLSGALLLFGASAAADIFYSLSLNEDLSEVSVEARFPADGRPLEAADGEARELAGLVGCDGESIRVLSGRIPTQSANGCLRYRYPLNLQSGRRSPPVVTGVKVTTPGEWLWLPELSAGQRVLIDVHSVNGASVSVPWKPLGSNRFELRPSPGSSTGTAVFGGFSNLTVQTAGTRLQVAALDGPDMRLDHDKVLEWLTVAANDVAGVGGRFPNPNVQVIVHPVRSRGRSPVPFGYVIRDGGEAVRFYVDPERAIADYHGDWTATHEFAHLLLPYVRSREKWVSEGFASYYQNVLLARRGAYDEEEVWRRLTRSFGRADDVRNPPRLDRLHERSFRDVRMLVYWSGAALALIADVQLRALGRDVSLDSVLGELADCCLPSERAWTAADLFQQLDSFTPEPVFVPLYEDFMARRGMPELQDLYEDLGIEVIEGAVKLRSEGRLVPVREAIMRPTPGRRI